MRAIPKPVEDVATMLCRLPGVGEKTALRYALALVSDEGVAMLGEALMELPLLVKTCPHCRALTDGTCPFCARTSDIVCVVHRFVDLLAVERAHLGCRYFVLGKLIAPLEGVDMHDLPLNALRAQVEDAKEVVLALPASVDGEATAMCIASVLRSEASDRTVSRLARGLSHGHAVEFADAVTMRGAFDERARA